ncbi:Fur family transcriptional regulator [Brachybacterium sp. AOP25-B2-12]|uniref:Fur family transcriptional regulator n=1 Tax=Brachybacterium sp. AOP25-B2-12 TaxID=3457710 RepID=UPI004034694B
MSTVQTRRVRAALEHLGHATNSELHAELGDVLPELSLTSLHRITARLLERGEIGSVPHDGRGAIFDARAETHDHFVCRVCGIVVDIEIPAEAREAIQEQLGTHLVDDGLVVRGTCAICREVPRAGEPPAP